MDDGGAAAATLQVLLQNLISVSKEEISLVRGFKKEAEKLSETLDTIQKFLSDAEMRPISDKAVKSWLNKLEAVAFDADNVLDELNYEVLSKKMKTMKTVKKKKKFPSCFPSFNHIVRRRQMALTIKHINMNLESVNKQANELGLERRLATAHAVPDVGLETDSFAFDPIFLGRDSDVSRIVEMLATSPTEQVFSILPIVGMGGLGKTTLTRRAYSDDKIKMRFGNHIWVHVSKNFDPMILFKNIFSSLGSTNSEAGTREDLLKELQQALKDKTHLLVLDDLWNEDVHKWQDFINSLSGISSTKGNGIIVTTRSKEVASIVGTLPIHELGTLSKDDCWSIIKAKAFRQRDDTSEFEATGRIIAGKCQGLPLAANVVGGLLRGKSEDEWRSVQENWLSDFGGNENNISKILRLSFDNLSSPSLKKCFAYWSIFPKGLKIRREKLIELWMAEGFLQTDDQRNEMETVGNKFFNLLVQNSLLQVVEKDGYGNAKHCSMHDLVHDVGCSVLGSKVKDNNLDEVSNSRYIWCESMESISEAQAKCLRSLIIRGHEFSDTRFWEFKSLHVLVLIGGDVKELPSLISKLIHLRYLDVSYTSILCLPDSIGELYHLQTLRAAKNESWEKSYLLKLPNTLKYLFSLRHLYIPGDIELPPEIGRLTSLQTLPHFEVGDEKGRGITELGSLKNLKGKLEIRNLEKVHGAEEAKSAGLFEKSGVFELKLVWSESREGEIDDENVLEGLQHHPNLKSLEIYRFKGRSFPAWILKMAVRDDCWIGLDNLMQISLINCEICEEIPMLGHLPHLKSLYLCSLNNVRSIGSSFYGIDNCSRSSSSNNGAHKEAIIVFRELQKLELECMPNLREWVEVELRDGVQTQQCEVVVFPCLEYLKINICEQLMSAPSHFPCLKELDISVVESGSPLANICGMKLITLTKLAIMDLDGLVSLPSWLFYNNQNLSELQIFCCPNLTHLAPSLGGGSGSLRKFHVSGCSNLIELPDDLLSLNSLKELRIEGCPNLKSIPYPSGRQSQEMINVPSELVESCVSSLESLSLERLSSLTNLPVVIGCLRKMPRLTSLSIADVPKFTSSAAEIGSQRRLQELVIYPAASDADYVSFKETLDGMFHGSRSLRILNLSGMEHWDSLPDQLQHLLALTDFSLHGFGIEVLPEWFGKLSSLEILSISDCKYLRRLPSMEAMRGLKKLTELHITHCPLLGQIKQRSGDDPEWLKISHIRSIYVDGLQLPFWF